MMYKQQRKRIRKERKHADVVWSETLERLCVIARARCQQLERVWLKISQQGSSSRVDAIGFIVPVHEYSHKKSAEKGIYGATLPQQYPVAGIGKTGGLFEQQQATAYEPLKEQKKHK